MTAVRAATPVRASVPLAVAVQASVPLGIVALRARARLTLLEPLQLQAPLRPPSSACARSLLLRLAAKAKENKHAATSTSQIPQGTEGP